MTEMKRVNPIDAAKNALEFVLRSRKGEDIVIFYDEEKAFITESFTLGALALTKKEHEKMHEFGENLSQVGFQRLLREPCQNL